MKIKLSLVVLAAALLNVDATSAVSWTSFSKSSNTVKAAGTYTALPAPAITSPASGTLLPHGVGSPYGHAPVTVSGTCSGTATTVEVGRSNSPTDATLGWNYAYPCSGGRYSGIVTFIVQTTGIFYIYATSIDASGHRSSRAQVTINVQ